LSLEATNWVLNDATGLPSHAFAVLMGLANHANPEGKGAFTAQGTLGHYARKTDRQVRRDLQELEAIGLIRRGDQRLVAHLPRDKRPVVWDLAMERRMPDWHFGKGDPEGTGEPGQEAERPDVDVPPDVEDRAPRSGRRSPRGRTRPDADDRPDAHDRTQEAERPDVDVLQTVLEPEATTTTSSPSAAAPPEGAANKARPDAPKSKPSAPTREDAERLCAHLADAIEANGSLRPTITDRWRDAARLMIDKDGRSEEQIHRAIDWCQEHEFWRSNILSMIKLREKYDQLRLQATRPAPAANGHANGVQPSRNMQILAAAAARLDAEEAAQARVIQGEAW